MIGVLTRLGNLALAPVTFDVGPVDLIDLDNNVRGVSAQKDFVYMASYAAAPQGGPLSIGLTGKYLQSRIAEAATADAFLPVVRCVSARPGGEDDGPPVDHA